MYMYLELVQKTNLICIWSYQAYVGNALYSFVVVVVGTAIREVAFIHALSTAILLQVMIQKEATCKWNCILESGSSEGCAGEVCTPDSYSCCLKVVKAFTNAGDKQLKKEKNDTFHNRVRVNEHNRAVALEVSTSVLAKLLLSPSNLVQHVTHSINFHIALWIKTHTNLQSISQWMSPGPVEGVFNVEFAEFRCAAMHLAAWKSSSQNVLHSLHEWCLRLSKHRIVCLYPWPCCVLGPFLSRDFQTMFMFGCMLTYYSFVVSIQV